MTPWEPLVLSVAYGEGYRSPQALLLDEGEPAPFTKVRSADVGRALLAAATWGSCARVFSTRTSDKTWCSSRPRAASSPPDRVRGSARCSTESCVRWPWLRGAASLTYVRATLDDPPPRTARRPESAVRRRAASCPTYRRACCASTPAPSTRSPSCADRRSWDGSGSASRTGRHARCLTASRPIAVSLLGRGARALLPDVPAGDVGVQPGRRAVFGARAERRVQLGPDGGSFAAAGPTRDGGRTAHAGCSRSERAYEALASSRALRSPIWVGSFALLAMACGDTGRERVELALFASGSAPRHDRARRRGRARHAHACRRRVWSRVLLCLGDGQRRALRGRRGRAARDRVGARARADATERWAPLAATTGSIQSACTTTACRGCSTAEPKCARARIAPDGHSAILEGTVERAGQLLRFSAAIDAKPGKRGPADRQHAAHAARDRGRRRALTLLVDPTSWIDRLDVDDLFALDVDGDGSVVIAPGTTLVRVDLAGHGQPDAGRFPLGVSRLLSVSRGIRCRRRRGRAAESRGCRA